MNEIYTSMIILTIKFPKKVASSNQLFVTTCLVLLGV